MTTQITTLILAGLSVRIQHQYPYFACYAADYVTEAPPDISLTVGEAELLAEQPLAPPGTPPPLLEVTAIHRRLGAVLPHYDALVFHGAVIACEGRAYLVTARSGVGKTTHLRLWLQVFGDRVHILNGDKPILRIRQDVPYACGTPWRGKEGYGVREDLPLSGIAFLERAADNTISPMPRDVALPLLLSQLYLPREPAAARAALSVADRLLSGVPTYRLCCNRDPEAARVAYRGLTGMTVPSVLESGDSNEIYG